MGKDTKTYMLCNMNHITEILLMQHSIGIFVAKFSPFNFGDYVESGKMFKKGVFKVVEGLVS